jgi:hypothetical protein
LKLYPRTPGDDWKKYPNHARFTSNPGENIAGFWPRGLKWLEMLLALVYYHSLQNVVPFYDQRATLPMKDSTWDMFCQNSLKHFEKAFELK